ncbi:MAG TPA: peptidylprolyl isomerase [Anaeromyxobacteraceae bacterium]|nr:peptidylprolyl isomerase [Anaeromyxobacteraceae bacterium]
MARKAVTLLLVVLAACGGTSAKKGPLLAKGRDVAVAAGDLKARIDEMPAFIRSRLAEPERRKEMLDELVRLELLAHAAEKGGMAQDPAVQLKLATVLATAYQQKFLQDLGSANLVPDAAVQKYYEDNPEEFHRPYRIHAAHILFVAEAGSPGRAKKAAAARAVLARVLAEEPKNRAAFALTAREVTEDPASKASGGDLLWRTPEQLETGFGRELLQAVERLKDGETATSVVETSHGIHLVHLYGRDPESHQTLEEARPVIVRMLAKEWQAKAVETHVKALRAEAGVTVDEAALEAAAAAGAQPPAQAAAQVVPASASTPAAPSTTASR